MNIYVGNISKDVTDEELQALFTEFGTVKSSKIIRDMFSGESRGFGFVEMASQTEGQKAITDLNLTELKGRRLTVNEARPKTDKRGGSGGGGSRSGGGNRNGGSSGGGGRRSW